MCEHVLRVLFQDVHLTAPFPIFEYCADWFYPQGHLKGCASYCQADATAG